MPPPVPPAPDAARDFLVRIARLLHRYGTPAHRLERVLQKVATGLGEEASFFVTPTSVFAAFGAFPDVRTYLVRSDSGEVDLGKLVEFDDVMEDVEHGRCGVAVATQRLDAIAAAPPRYPPSVTALSFGIASACAACFFAGGGPEVALSFALGLATFALGRLLAQRSEGLSVFEPLAAFVAAAVALAMAHFTALDHRVVTLSSLIVLVPGLTLTTGMIELATRHLVSGVARLAGAATTFLTILLGVALAWRLGEALAPLRPAQTPHPLPPWAVWAALAVAPLAFGILLHARPRELGVIYLTGVVGFLAARFGAVALGKDLGAFLGALVVGLAGNLYARALDRPSSVPVTPGILLLVPGSLGYRSLTSFLDREALAGMEWAFQTSLVAVSLVGGLLAANVLLPPRRVL